MNKVIAQLYASGYVEGRSGTRFSLHSAIDPAEGEFLQSMIRVDQSITRTIEVGCAYGLSSLFICDAVLGRPGAKHTAIDPYESTQWDGAALVALDRAGFSDFELIEDKSEFALPALVEKEEGKVDLVLVDGFHTFDHTLIDCFYATRLLRIGGILIIDDVSLPAVRRVVDLLLTYPCYESCGSVGRHGRPDWKKRLAQTLAATIDERKWRSILSRTLCNRLFDPPPRMLALRKRAADDRDWNWYREF